MAYSDIILFVVVFVFGTLLLWKVAAFLIWKLETRLFFTSLAGYLKSGKNKELPKNILSHEQKKEKKSCG